MHNSFDGLAVYNAATGVPTKCSTSRKSMLCTMRGSSRIGSSTTRHASRAGSDLRTLGQRISAQASLCLRIHARWNLESSITSIASPKSTSSSADNTAVYTVSEVEQAAAWLAHMIPGAQSRPELPSGSLSLTHTYSRSLCEHTCAFWRQRH